MQNPSAPTFYSINKIVTGLLCILLTGCSSFQLPSLWPKKQEPIPVEQTESNPPSRTNVLQEFERKIFSQLLEEMPEWQVIATTEERQSYHTAAARLISESGISPALLESQQRQSLENIEHLNRQTKFELEHWSQLNHLRQLDLIYSQPELEVATDKVLQNLRKQSGSDAPFPKMYLDAAEQVAANVNLQLVTQIRKLKVDDQTWAKNRLDLLLSQDQQQAAYEQLQTLLAAQRKQVRGKFPNARESYRDKYYDIRNERQPEQLALDLITLNLSNSLATLKPDAQLSIQGDELGRLALHQTLRDEIRLSLIPLMQVPAFEYESLANQITGQLSANPKATPPFRFNIGVALGQWLEQIEISNQPEVNLGFAVAKQRQLEFAAAELALALGEKNMAQVLEDLSQLPYSQEQQDLFVLDWFAQPYSSVVGLLIADRLSQLEQQQLMTLLKEPVASYEDLTTLLAEQLSQ